MDKADCYYLGYVSGTHGLNGELEIFLDVDKTERYLKLESVFIEHGSTLLPFFIERIKVRDKTAIVKFEGLDDIDHSSQLSGHNLFLPLSSLPPLSGNKFYYHEIIGFRVVDKNLGELGIIRNVLYYPHQVIAQMEFKEKEVLFPVIDEILVKVDRESKQLHVVLPEGLLEVYL